MLRSSTSILIYREMFPIGPALVERLLAMRGRPPVVFDFDDAIFLPSVSDANRAHSGVEAAGQSRDDRPAQRSRHRGERLPGGLCPPVQRRGHGDPNLRRHDTICPVAGCSLDQRRTPRATGRRLDRQSDDGAVCARADRCAAASPQQHPFVLRVSGAGEPLDVPGVTTEQPEWTLDGEVELFNTCDVGIYPLADDEWSRGKCGFKAIEFMACGVPVVAAAVGVNRESSTTA